MIVGALWFPKLPAHDDNAPMINTTPVDGSATRWRSHAPAEMRAGEPFTIVKDPFELLVRRTRDEDPSLTDQE